MITDHIEKSAIYGGISERFDQAFAYLRSFDSSVADGRYDLDGDRVFALVQTISTADPASGIYESHQVYADVHFVVEGTETIYYRPTGLLQPRGEYDAKIEARLYDGEDVSALVLGAGDFAAFWPQDGHKPCCWTGEKSTVRKVVMKIRLVD